MSCGKTGPASTFKGRLNATVLELSVLRVAPLFAILSVVLIYSLGSRVSRSGVQGSGGEKGTPEWRIGVQSKGQRDGYMVCVYGVCLYGGRGTVRGGEGWIL